MAPDEPTQWLSPEEIERVLSPLDETERQLLRLRFGINRDEPCSLEDIALQLDTTANDVRLRIDAAMSKLR